MPDLVVDDVTFRYPGATAPALSDVRLGIGQGEVVLVAGPSGCGKSTLALALCGLVPARVRGHLSGSVHLGGVALSSLQPHQVATQVGMVFQDPASQLITPTVEAEVAFGPENLALARDDISRRVEQALTATGTDRMRRASTASLSGERSSAWPSPLPWPCAPTSSSSTSRARISTPEEPKPSWLCCADSTGNTA